MIAVVLGDPHLNYFSSNIPARCTVGLVHAPAPLTRGFRRVSGDLTGMVRVYLLTIKDTYFLAVFEETLAARNPPVTGRCRRVSGGAKEYRASRTACMVPSALRPR
jgi:hypothetical protein